MNIKSLHIYPVKSAHAVNITTINIRPRGLTGDRRYMLVDSDGKFITQRQIPKLARLKVETLKTGIALHWPDTAPLFINADTFHGRNTVTVWRSSVDASLAHPSINETLSSWLGTHVSLVHMDEKSERFANPDWTDSPSPVSFADGYPILITNTASLTALNALILSGGGTEVPMSQFRPNIVIDSNEPWGEDHWKALQIGDVVLDLVKPCARCIMTTINQKTGEKLGREPLRALKNLRPSIDPRNPGVLFGMNAVARICGEVTNGSRVVLGIK
ncbi:MAG: MOSC domain-containing protein [Robiginitomaculum sp.]|nr:MOSC domain-containing protein [Robiginitomaculum sp.]